MSNLIADDCIIRICGKLPLTQQLTDNIRKIQNYLNQINGKSDYNIKCSLIIELFSFLARNDILLPFRDREYTYFRETICKRVEHIKKTSPYFYYKNIDLFMDIISKYST